ISPCRSPSKRPGELYPSENGIRKQNPSEDRGRRIRFWRTRRLRHHEDAELPKMIVDRQSDFDLHFVDDDFARAIGEAPTACGSRLKENPRPVNLIRRKKMNPAHVFLEQGAANFSGKSGTFSRRKKSKRF